MVANTFDSPRAFLIRIPSQWQVSHLSCPLTREATLSQQEQVVESLTDRQRLVDHKNSRHRQAISYTRVGVCRHRTHIVGQDHAVFLCRLHQRHWISLSRQDYLLGAHHIQRWQTLAVSRAKSRSEVRAKAIGVGSSALFGTGMRRDPLYSRPHHPGVSQAAVPWSSMVQVKSR
jgi:hypothetical protein